MRPTLRGRFSRQVDLLRQQFLQEGRALPFTEILSAECFAQVLERSSSVGTTGSSRRW